MKTTRKLAESLIDRYLEDEVDPKDVAAAGTMTVPPSKATGTEGEDEPDGDEPAEEDDEPTDEDDEPMGEDDLGVEADRFVAMHSDQIERGEDMRMLINNYAATMNLSANDLYDTVVGKLTSMGKSYR